MALIIAALKDCIQEVRGNLEVLEIRVWCHPHLNGESGDDYWHTFDSFSEAFDFIKSHKEAEDQPLLAFRGYEINLFGELKDQ